MTRSISDLKRLARQSLKGYWGRAVLLTFIMFLINTILPMMIETKMSGGYQAYVNHKSAGADVVGTIISFVLIPLSITVYWFYLTMVRSENPQIAQVFTALQDIKTYLKLLGLGFLQALFIFLWSLLFLVPGIIKSLSYSQTYFIIRDHPEYTVTQAITESRKLMKGHKWKYFFLGLSFIGWAILAVIPFGIGLLWLIPYVTATLAAFYNELLSSQEQKPEEKNGIF